MSETPAEYNAKIISGFRANEGCVGGEWEGTTMLLLHHTGMKLGVMRVNPVAYLPDEQRYFDLGRKRRSAEHSWLVLQPQGAAEHAHRGRHRADRIRGRGGDWRGARAALCKSSPAIPGLDVHHAARVAAAAHGGQVVDL
jgi:hypothetical protein